jgi:hypothetical protein
MKSLFVLVMLLTAPLWADNFPGDIVSQSASGSTAATTYFAPGMAPGFLVAADVTSDKAASVMSWSVGGKVLTLLAAAADNATSFTVTAPGTVVATNISIVSVTAAGTVTAHTTATSTLVTNREVFLYNPISTNLTTSGKVREMTSTYWAVVSKDNTNAIRVPFASVVTTNASYVAQAENFACEIIGVESYATNAGAKVLTLSNAVTITPVRIYLLTTNLYSVTLAATQPATSVILGTSTGLAAGDWVTLSPGGAAAVELRQVSGSAPYIYQTQTIAAPSGVALAKGDRLFVMGTAQTTAVGATTLRLFGDLIRYQPIGVPAKLSVDGTSTCTVNSATVKY